MTTTDITRELAGKRSAITRPPVVHASSASVAERPIPHRRPAVRGGPSLGTIVALFLSLMFLAGALGVFASAMTVY